MCLLKTTPYYLKLAPNSKKFSELLATRFTIFKNETKNEVPICGASSPPIANKKFINCHLCNQNQTLICLILNYSH